MNVPWRFLLVACSLLGSVVRCPAVEPFVLDATEGRNWYRGNMHTHSLWSDGDDYLESIARWYREHDYQFLVFTDHNVLADSERWIDVEKSKGKRAAFDKLVKAFPGDWVEQRTTEDGRLEVKLKTFVEVAERFDEPGKFLLVQGEEITDRYKNLPVHMNATNTPERITPLGGESVREVMQNNIDRALAIRERTGRPMIVHLNHPNFGYGVTAEDLLVIRGENFFEVYNGHPGVHNSGDSRHANTERIWDIVNARRATDVGLPTMFGLATDDGHNYHGIPNRKSNPGRGWVEVLTKELTPKALIASLEAGRFYSSSGVELERIAVDEKGMEVRVAEQEGERYVIEFIGTDRDFDPASQPVLDSDGQPMYATRKYSEEVGRVLKTVDGPRGRYDFTGEELYVRARITSSRRHPNPSEEGDYEQAWVQPVRVAAQDGESEGKPSEPDSN